MKLGPGDALLGGRYELLRHLDPPFDEGRLWTANDNWEYVKPYLLKTWHFSEEGPDQVQRAFWDAELRSLYQVRSSPGSERSLLQLHNVGIDHDHHCFVMVFETNGHRTLASMLADRRSCPWLSGRPSDRQSVWRMLGRLASGLELLHQQQVVHRCVSAETVFLDPDSGPESARLGGFEWSVRLGRPPAAARTRRGWETPPEWASGRQAFGPDADWFAFGMLAARCMVDIEHLGSTADLAERYLLVQDQLGKGLGGGRRRRDAHPVPNSRLTQLERDVIGRLIAEEPTERLRRGDEVQAFIREVIDSLEEPPESTDANQRHFVVVNAGNQRLVEVLEAQGLRSTLGLQPGDAFSSKNKEHVTKLLGFLYDDFSEGGLLSPGLTSETVVLSGKTLHLELAKHDDRGNKSWEKAFCQRVLDYFEVDPQRSREIPVGQLAFITTQRQPGILAPGVSWDLKIPSSDEASERQKNQEDLAEFIRLTNQIDLLIRDAEIFRCQVSDVWYREDGSISWIEVQEMPRHHLPLEMFKPDGGMAAFLLRDMYSGKSGSNEIELCPADFEGLRSVSPADGHWELVDAYVTDETVRLRPAGALAGTVGLDGHKGGGAEGPRLGQEYVLRTKGLYRQLQLIRRRKKAIERLADHTYLLASLSNPGQVFMDSGALPVGLDGRTVDASKRTQIGAILGTRPIYTVQGPPGTGKTHMAAWLLREILAEDPMAQILITAQAHSAVDVLRAKVESEAFKGIPEESRPLSIRLRRTVDPRRTTDSQDERWSVRYVARELLDSTITRLESLQAEEPLSEVSATWLEACRTMRREIDTQDASQANEFRELVRRSASITYSSASDGDLAGLAGEVSYDWSIVEEAGKAHGFELALPLYLGHRWLLIGDPQQLPPYRMEDYQKALSNLERVVQALRDLEGADRLIDRELLNRWRDKAGEEKKYFTEYCRRWLTFFGQLHRLCTAHEPEEGLLTGQYRMHPDIGDLVSQTYYKGKLQHHTHDRAPHGLTAPAELEGKAVVWLDLPAASVDPRTAETAQPKYRNEAEAHALEVFLRSLRGDPTRPVDLAVLSPYAQQVVVLGKHLRRPEMRAELLRNGIALAPDPRGADGGHSARAGDPNKGGVFTVDSFQGNQSEIVAVSLVRNNMKQPGQGLGFLKATSRMNVLISRAERLLVLVGSWDFFRAQVSDVPRDERQYDELRHVAVLVDRFEKLFAEGRAVRVAADLTGLDERIQQAKAQRSGHRSEAHANKQREGDRL
ncbi:MULTISPECIES: AAA domain-containing protein [unclassified Streptomyces]|uniref:AAA domain-containing protein n=1 Tax=unclassified Streptomyces TaxID=2593676 RepID=UPI00225BF468|nr:AAA domain-containing protein [Streptomyces sp. NBC_01551]MCX4528569.1 AAA domain-containing protein [Streptomyces sp. NBC_01551]